MEEKKKKSVKESVDSVFEKSKWQKPEEMSDQAWKFIKNQIDTGCPVKMAIFHSTVRSVKGEPETAFYAPEPGMRPSRTANLWINEHLLICEQKGSYKVIPNAQVKDTNA